MSATLASPRAPLLLAALALTAAPAAAQRPSTPAAAQRPVAAAAARGAAATADAQRPAAPRWPLARFTQHEVSVAFAADVDGAGRTWLLATFVPLRAGFHLYSTDLPRDGIQGIGRPTLLEVVAARGLAAPGTAVADQAATTLYVPALEASFPVYPPGPVTLRLPVTCAGPDGPDATLSVTYMACGGGTCLPPVVDRRTTVRLPAACRRPSKP